MPTNSRTIHFIGIGGTGMSAIAKVLLEAGNTITGSDLRISEATERLSAQGADIHLGHRKENLRYPDLVVVSSAIPTDNVEVMTAYKRGIKVMQRGEMLAELMSQRKGIAIAGAHGKTTTTSMASLVLEKAGLDPTVLIGGELNDIGGNAKLGRGEYLIAEADESDGSFLKLRPHIAVVTNVEDDHLDYYGSLDNIVAAFKSFIERIPTTGAAIICADNCNAMKIAAAANTSRRITFGTRGPADYEARSIKFKSLASSCQIWEQGQYLGSLRLMVPGVHSILNALATVALARQVGVDFDVIRGALATFRGVQRRFQHLGTVNGVYVVDDYGHHPTEIAATLSAAKQGRFNRIICVFQPHRYSRTKFLHREFGTAFHEADLLIITDIYPAGEAPMAGVSSQLIVDAVVAESGPDTVLIPALKDVVPYLLKLVKPGDMVLTLGAGNIFQAGVELVQGLPEAAQTVET
ncbi:MAG TPA: UDP-N-acetylmuramate--L-alanine ligase [bacterium]|jgi:UDP-N-acetylmuramate--alanine ligase|nr:UDP-N-acetylmuramate--L-alanine ligase [bacterium]